MHTLTMRNDVTLFSVFKRELASCCKNVGHLAATWTTNISGHGEIQDLFDYK